jgi:hypothetical protein
VRFHFATLTPGSIPDGLFTLMRGETLERLVQFLVSALDAIRDGNFA